MLIVDSILPRWRTILNKREHFRSAFAQFEIDRVAAFDDADRARLLADAGIVRHRGKIESAIQNAARAIELRDEFGSLATYFWRHEPKEPSEGLPSMTAESKALSKDLKKRGWTYVGPTTVYAFMQAMGMVNDHLEGCAARERVAKARAAFAPPV